MTNRGDYPYGGDPASSNPVTKGFRAVLDKLGADQGPGSGTRADYPYGGDPASTNPVTKGFRAVLDLLDATGVVVGTPWTSDPIVDGTASAGSSDDYARGDHVHPTDTSREAAGLGITGASVGDTPVVSAVDESGTPTSWEAVALSRIMTISLTDSEGQQVSGQTITVREGGASGEVLAQLAYSGVPMQVTLPIGLHYYVSASDGIPMQGRPSTATGIIGMSDVQVALQYGTLDSVLVKDAEAGRYTNESLADWWRRQRDGKVYGIQEPKAVSTIRTKTDDAAGLPAPTPGWDGHPAVDVYDGLLGPFRRVDVNGGSDPDGTPFVTAIRGIDDDFALDGSNGDAWSMVPVWYQLHDESGAEYVVDKITDTPRTGFSPCLGAKYPDETLRPYMLYAKYGGSQGADGKMHSCSGKYLWNRTVSHNSLITQCDTANTGYSGYNSADLHYVQTMLKHKYATKDTQTLLMGCVSYNLSYEITVAETGVRRAIIATSQAANLVVGSAVTIGTADHGTQVMTAAKITSIEAYDETNSVINLDASADFDTTVGNKLSTEPWYTGRTDAVEGDGACTQAGLLSGKEPYKVQGIEVAYGATEILGNVILSNDGVTGWLPFVNHDSRNEATSVTDAYEACDEAVMTTDTDGWKYGPYAHESNGLAYATATGGSTTTGMADGNYTNKLATTGTREWLSWGNLDYGRSAGPWCAYLSDTLGHSGWHISSRRSAHGISHA